MLQLVYKTEFSGFELIDSGQGARLERFGEFVLSRPDPQAIWQCHLPRAWDRIDALFSSGAGERGLWKFAKNNPLPASWTVDWQDVKLTAKLTPFKHTGIFPEQAANWEWMAAKLQVESRKYKVESNKPKILNLFGYTGAASVILAKAGCFVTHVDASKPAISWAKENQQVNNLPADSIRWILDDAAKFVEREVKRGSQYDGILMDPPAFGHSPSGKPWKFNKDLPSLLANCAKLLSAQATFLLVNGYATNASPLSLHNLLEDTISDRPGNIEYGELCLQQRDHRLLSTGIFARWSR